MVHGPISGGHGEGFESPHVFMERTQKNHRYSVSVKLLVITTLQSICLVLMFYAVLLMKEPQQFMKEMSDLMKHWLF